MFDASSFVDSMSQHEENVINMIFTVKASAILSEIRAGLSS